VEACPKGWFRVDLHVSMTVTSARLALTVLTADQSSARVYPPLSVSRAMRELRELMHVDGRGTWLSLRYSMDSPTEYHVVYNHDYDPKWSPDLDAREWALDLEHFPRAPEQVPDWLRARLTNGTDQLSADADGIAEPLNPAQQNELLERITRRLMLDLPAGWNHLQISHKALGDHVEVGGLLRMSNGAMFGWDLPDEVPGLFARLRSGLARPGRGTWLLATYWLDYPDMYSIEYNRQDEPRFRIPPPPHAHARELAAFPRTEEHIPGWLRTAVAGH
jgi:hypothetical protein